jgi:hypothetical protein
VSSTESTTQNGSTTFSYSVSANTTASSRNATLSFITTSGGNAVARTHRISQEGAPDTVPPVITRIGPPTSTIEASWIANYIDAGATCLDEVDGVLSHAVEVSGQVVNLRHPGTYTIRYNCEDSSGNEADEIIRTVTVKDTLPPVITLAGDDTLTTEAGFPYQDPGAGAEDSLDGDVNVSVDDSSMDTGVVGSHTVTYTATDAAGNVAELTRTVNVIVTQAPAITNLAGAGVPKTLNALSITFASYLNASYILECSRDLLNWEQVREVQGAAQSTTVTIDEPILDGGGVYYRLGVKL